jgi:hypothetical protein
MQLFQVENLRLHCRYSYCILTLFISLSIQSTGKYYNHEEESPYSFLSFRIFLHARIFQLFQLQIKTSELLTLIKEEAVPKTSNHDNGD